MNQRLEVMARLSRKKGKELYNIVSRRYLGYKNPRKKPSEGKNKVSVPMTFSIQSKNHNGAMEKLFAALLLALFSTLLVVDCITVFKSYIYPYISIF